VFLTAVRESICRDTKLSRTWTWMMSWMILTVERIMMTMGVIMVCCPYSAKVLSVEKNADQGLYF
jgi:hypothetical protein